MTTSLAAQLKKLATPQTKLLTQDKKRASLLFDPKDAANKDRETIYEIGLSGLHELIKLNPKFSKFEITLFSLSARNFERSVQMDDTNQKLDKNIRNFLLLLSPYFLLQPAHKCLEWLINRFHIHDFNKDQLMMLILPYHETRIFVRCVQLLDISDNSDRWNWLQPLQKPGVPLSKTTFLNRCASDISLVQFIGATTLEAIKIHDNRANTLGTMIAFYCTSFIGALEHAKDISEPLVTAMLPSLLKSLSSNLLNFAAAGLMILGQLVTKTDLSLALIEQLVLKISNMHHPDLKSECVLSLVLIYKTQQETIKTIPHEALNNILKWNWFPSVLGQLDANVACLLMPVLEETLELVQSQMESPQNLRNFAENLLTEIKLNDEDAAIVIRCVLNSYKYAEENTEEATPMVTDKIQVWYSNYLKRLENQYSDVFDKIVKQTLREKGKLNKHLKVLLGFMPGVVHQVGNISVFEKLYHPECALRSEAIQYIIKNIKQLNVNDNELLRTGIVERLNDDSPHVIRTVLKLKSQVLVDIVGRDKLIDNLIGIIRKCQSNKKVWGFVSGPVLNALCSSSVFTSDTKIFLAVFPYLLPSAESEVKVALNVLQSDYGRNCDFIKAVAKGLAKSDNVNASAVCNVVCDILNIGKFLPTEDSFIEVINSMSLKRDEYVFKLLSMFLLTSALPENCPASQSRKVLELAFTFVVNSRNIPLRSEYRLCGDVITKCVDVAQSGKLPSEGFIYCINGVITRSNIGIVPPWLNLSEQTAEISLLLRLFEILLTGCSLEHHDFVLLYTETMKRFFQKFLPSFKQQFEFMANLFVGHVVNKQNNGTCVEINPEYQLRALDLATSLLSLMPHDDSDSFHFIIAEESVTVPALLIALTSPFRQIRTGALSLIKLIASLKYIRNSTKSDHYLVLLVQLMKRSEELLLDHEQLSSILYTMFSFDRVFQRSSKRMSAIKMKRALNSLLLFVGNVDHPVHAIDATLKILTFVNSDEVLKQISKQGLCTLDYGNKSTDKTLDTHRSSILQNIITRYDKDTVQIMQNDFASWNLLENCLKYHDVILMDDDKITYPAVLLMKQIDNDVFKNIPSEKHKGLLSLIIDSVTDSENPLVVSSASKFFKNIELDASLIYDELVSMLNAKSPEVALQVKKRRNLTAVMTPSPNLLLTRNWKRGVTLLEFIQNKKKLTNIEVILPILFDILKRCLDFEVQAPVEYTKQLLLSCILHCCQKLSPEGLPVKGETLPDNTFNIELVVQCIRGTQNPQTHHHALLVLCHTAGMIPDQVLLNIMSIFTFMGSSILRHDDAYSFQIISKLIETVVPILINNKNPIGQTLSEKETEELNPKVAQILRVFVDVILDIPEHRRILLFKKLLDTLNAKHFLWLFLALIFESHVIHGNNERTTAPNSTNVGSPRRLEIASSLMHEFDPEIIINTCDRLIIYLKTLPFEKDDKRSYTDYVYNIGSHSQQDLRHFKFILIKFLSGLISSPVFINKFALMPDEDTNKMEAVYKTMIVNILTYIQAVSKVADQNIGKPRAKYWKIMLHHSFDILDNINALLSADMFLLVIKGLMSHNFLTVRRKAMELLNNKLQHNAKFFNDCKMEGLYGLLTPLISVVETINSDNETDSALEQEMELNQQTALLSLKLLAKLLGPQDPAKFKPILDLITDLLRSEKAKGNVLASVVLCLAELCSNLRAHSISSLTKFMPALIKILKTNKSLETKDSLLFTVIIAIHKIIETLSMFLSPYLDKLLLELALLSALLDKQPSQKTASIISKLKTVHQLISSSFAPRILIPAIGQCYKHLLQSQKYDSIKPIMAILADSFSNIQPRDLNSLQIDLTTFFLNALQFRGDVADTEITQDHVSQVETHVISALVELVLKLSEGSFRVLYYKLYDWSVRNNCINDRAITFYRLSGYVAESLKGIFVLFAGHFLTNAANLLDECNNTKRNQLYFDNSEEKCVLLIESILKTLNAVFLYDGQKFINKERFDTLMQPIVDQVENTVGGLDSLKERTKTLLVPCIAQFAIATADDALWKQLHYQLLLKTRHNTAEIRLCALEILCEMAKRLGDDFLALLPETVPFLAELMEDENETVEAASRKVLQELETITGESLQKYF